MNTVVVLTHLEVCAPVGGNVEDLDGGDDGAHWPEHRQVNGLVWSESAAGSCRPARSRAAPHQPVALLLGEL